MEVVVKAKFIKDLRRVPKHIFQATDHVIDKLRAAENFEKSGLDYQKCQGKKSENFYRIRVGDWRIGVELKHPTIIIITVLKRGIIYKKFPPR